MLLYSDMSNYYQQLIYIFQNVQTLLALIGLISETLIISVFLRKRLRNHSYAFYSIVMAFFDILVCLHTFRHWSALMFAADLDLVSQFFCAIGEYQPYLAATCTLWLLVLISLDRLITIVYSNSNRFRILKKRSFQVFVVIILIACNLLMHIELPLNYTLLTINGSNLTVCSIPYEIFNIHTWIYLTNVILIIVVVINILNFKMITYLLKTRNGLNLKSNRMSVLKDRKFALSSVGLNIANLVCKIPLGIALLASYYLDFGSDECELLFTICVTITISYNAISFGIYMIVNSIFYDEFLIMIGLKRSIFTKTSTRNNSNKNVKV